MHLKNAPTIPFANYMRTIGADMNATDVNKNQTEIKQEIARLEANLIDILKQCDHKWEDGRSALGRGSNNGACERLCMACDNWVE